ncbi:MAG: GreA/GreB family elongation factor [Deltaproteobacteria bacterium]|nr:GreA/GreB family elongation factor [Deltaproteobacteria bacterium]
MSKAFTRDDEGAPPPPAPQRRGVPVPEGVPNCMTPAGHAALLAEQDRLGRGERTPEIEARLRELAEHLATAQVTPPPADRAKVGFGATVTVEGEDGHRTRYRLVGAIEASPREGAISWQSPIANALWDATVGDSVALPKGDVEVVAIDYERADAPSRTAPRRG